MLKSPRVGTCSQLTSLGARGRVWAPESRSGDSDPGGKKSFSPKIIYIYSWGYNPPVTTWGESPSYTIVTGACFLQAVPVLDGFLSPPVLVLHELSLPSGLFLVLVASFLREWKISVPGACPITMFTIVLWRNPPFLGSWWPGWIPHFNGGSDPHLQHGLLENHRFSSVRWFSH